jgi:thioredoxin-dependent peroxiredoxin
MKEKQAPNFSLQDQNGDTKTMSDYAGKWLVLYFYPKDDTPGCTTEACGFRDAREALADLGNCEVIGVSKDSVRSHKKFAEKYSLTFTLLADVDHELAEAYDSWGPKKFMGKEFLGMKRNTFLINPSGTVVKEYIGVSPTKHAAEILTDLKELQKNA